MLEAADRDEQVSRLAVFESARAAAAQRTLVTAALLGNLGRLSAGPAPQAEPPWGELFGDAAQAQTQLLTSEVVYTEAAVTIASPLAQSLLVFLG